MQLELQIVPAEMPVCCNSVERAYATFRLRSRCLSAVVHSGTMQYPFARAKMYREMINSFSSHNQ